MDWPTEEDYYDDYSEFDAQVNDLKESLKKAVKQEHVDEMNRIKKENEELQEVKKNFEAIKEDYARKERELEYERKGLLAKVRQERLTELLKGSEVIMFKAATTYVDAPKCDQCDDYRYIHFESPSGRKMTEKCSCKDSTKMYVAEKIVRTEFKADNHRSVLWYKPYRDNGNVMVLDEQLSSDAYDKVFKHGDSFAKLDRYRTIFNLEEDCLEYCKFLQKKDEEESSNQ
ncbi:hypothetical protein EVJ32_04820 [Exiguobacterium sp. SH5S4]|uniref:hypothetical protein n=1 Tax=Exiguobacterium sp. SH5S4 TaxID=2510961 RepID=UPI00103C6987|nr:hypothetical protein [Exiguobacterium sp. SH5S4]TCI26700.1 hypothetical protein EVJ32_04820 [Exiguobacterium sp. SH5S4]